jgi:hypothetical protein
MSAKRGRLFAAAIPQQEAQPPALEAPQLPQASSRPDRRGKRLIGGYFEMPVSQQLKMLSAERNTNHQELLREALNDLFQKHGKSRIA